MLVLYLTANALLLNGQGKIHKEQRFSKLEIGNLSMSPTQRML